MKGKKLKGRFRDIFLTRTSRLMKKAKMISNGDKIFIALSGGKDSLAAAYAIKHFVETQGISCELIGFHINFDLPISNRVEEVVRQQCEILDIPLHVVHVKEFSIDMEKVASLRRPICSSCGVIKRYIMNKVPREMGASKLATGHHADDFLLFFFKNLIGGNLEWSYKFLPLLKGNDKQLTRIRPLFTVGSDDNRRLCEEEGLPFIQEDVCPHVYLKQKTDLKRERWLEAFRSISEWEPDFREKMMYSIWKLAERLMPTLTEPRSCSICGEPTSTEVCAFCRLLMGITKMN